MLFGCRSTGQSYGSGSTFLHGRIWRLTLRFHVQSADDADDERIIQPANGLSEYADGHELFCEPNGRWIFTNGRNGWVPRFFWR